MIYTDAFVSPVVFYYTSESLNLQLQLNRCYNQIILYQQIHPNTPMQATTGSQLQPHQVAVRQINSDQ
ncbi:unnamed protein product [Urochloa humidicola]